MNTTRNRTRTVLTLAAVAMATFGFAASANAADLYRSGIGAWDNSTQNWGAIGGPYNTAIWNSGTPDNATFEGTPGTVTVSGAISIQDMTFTSSTGGYVIDGGALNFGAGGTINNSDNRHNHTITSVITGSPAVNLKDFGAGNQYNGLIFAPGSGTQTLGAVLNPNNTGNTDKSGIFLGGSTTGNTVASIAYAGGDRYGRVVKQGLSTWTVGNVSTGFVDVNGGTLVGTGQLGAYYQEVRVNSGGTLSGNATIFTNDRRGSPHLKSGGTIAPGNSVGTITVAYGTGGGTPAININDYSFSLRTGSTYEWEVGAANATDTVHITQGGLILQDFTLKILDAGGTPAAIAQLPVFTYGSGVSRDMSGFLGSFDTSALGATWSATGLALTDDGAGTIYLTGLSNTAGGAIPEPATMCALGLAVAGLGGYVRKRRRA